MADHNFNWRAAWPWFLVLVLLLGPALSSCAPVTSEPTPTPTKTPYPSVAPAGSDSEPTPPGGRLTPRETAASPTAAPSDVPTTDPTDTPTPLPNSGGTVTNPQDLMASPDFGVQTFLWWREEVADRDLQLVRDAGFHWVKQLFSWQDIEGAGKGQLDWSRTDRIVQQVEAYGLKLIVRVSADPDRPFWAGNPPANSQDFADFLLQLATRYRGRIHAYQIWNEPNLAREWGGSRPDPAGYANMLKASYGAIKSADPAAIVVTAGMAPTTQNDNVAMPDLHFYQGLYDAMAGNSDGYFDMLGVHGTGWAVAPETDPQVVVDDPKLHNFDPSAPELLRVYAFRHVEDVRELMVRNGDEDKRVAILEFGWTTDSRPESPYYWHGAGAGVDEPTQGQYMVRAFKYAAENWSPWIGLMTVIYMPDVGWTKNDEQYWWSIMGPGYPDKYLRAPYVELCIYFNDVAGTHCPDDPNP